MPPHSSSDGLHRDHLSSVVNTAHRLQVLVGVGVLVLGQHLSHVHGSKVMCM